MGAVGHAGVGPRRVEGPGVDQKRRAARGLAVGGGAGPAAVPGVARRIVCVRARLVGVVAGVVGGEAAQPTEVVQPLLAEDVPLLVLHDAEGRVEQVVTVLVVADDVEVAHHEDVLRPTLLGGERGLDQVADVGELPGADVLVEVGVAELRLHVGEGDREDLGAVLVDAHQARALAGVAVVGLARVAVGDEGHRARGRVGGRDLVHAQVDLGVGGQEGEVAQRQERVA